MLHGRQKLLVQVKDQTWTAGNLALRLNNEKGVPVRVFRGMKRDGWDAYLLISNLGALHGILPVPMVTRAGRACLAGMLHSRLPCSWQGCRTLCAWRL